MVLQELFVSIVHRLHSTESCTDQDGAVSVRVTHLLEEWNLC